MNNNISIIAYLTPDIILVVKDLENHIRILVHTKGYENFLGENICLSIIFLGKTMNTINMQFKIKIDHIIDSLASTRIRLVRSTKNNFEDLAGLELKMKSMKDETRTIAPSNYSTFQNMENNLSIKFRDYKEELILESESDIRKIKIDNEEDYYSYDENDNEEDYYNNHLL